jgi:hypothetical protein
VQKRKTGLARGQDSINKSLHLVLLFEARKVVSATDLYTSLTKYLKYPPKHGKKPGKIIGHIENRSRDREADILHKLYSLQILFYYFSR